MAILHNAYNRLLQSLLATPSPSLAIHLPSREDDNLFDGMMHIKRVGNHAIVFIDPISDLFSGRQKAAVLVTKEAVVTASFDVVFHVAWI